MSNMVHPKALTERMGCALPADHRHVCSAAPRFPRMANFRGKLVCTSLSMAICTPFHIA